MPHYAESSGQIREYLRCGKSIDEFVPEVAQFIAERGIYS